MDPKTPTPGETPEPTEPKTNANPVTPSATPDPAIEEARKRAEQAEMRANQLQNQLKAKEDAEASAQAKELAEQNKFKELYEQEKARRVEVETAAEKAAREAAVKAESDKLFAEYPEEVRSLADEVGLTLADTDEDTTAAFKTKLEKISSSIKAPKVTPNNPGRPSAAPEMTNQAIHEIMRDPVKFQEHVQKNLRGVAAMTGK